eukprot:GEMP01087981.1.p1 GENE.GEMP01087981.1~~GEMP01087981.1.p1  ORF type:complete len:123 (+),score=37.31 GEMP01087981.1:31-399(+)
MKVKAHELRNKTSKELMKELEDLKIELATLRVAKVSGGAQAKLAKICSVRKGIARVLTVYNQKNKSAAREQYKNKKFVPKDLRPKKTRAIRRRLSSAQLKAKTLKQMIKARNFPKRRFAVKA